MARHLTDGQTRSRLNQGRVIEQAIRSDVEAVFSWVAISARNDGLAVRLHRVVDEGSPGHFDVYTFTGADTDDEFNDGHLLGVGTTIEEALAFAETAGAKPGRWVAEGTIQDEYRDRSP